MNFSLHFTPLIEFGEGKLDLIGDILKQDNRERVLIVTGKKSSLAKNALNRVKDALERKSISYIVYDEISTEPSTDMVDLLRELAEKEKVDSVLGLGGGSQMDTAKLVAGLLHQEKRTSEYVQLDGFVHRGIPFYAIPTTAGTASEVTRGAVFLDKERNNKYSFSHAKFMAKAAIIDPELTYGLSKEITATTGMDAFTHAVESFVAYESNEFTKFWAEEAIVLITKNLNEAIQGEREARINMAKASLYAGIAFAQTGVGLSHAISHPLGAFYHIPHGVANAILISHVINFNMRTSSDEYSRIERRLGLDTGLGEYVQVFVDELPIDTKLQHYGFQMEDAMQIAKLTMESKSYLRNPRLASEEEIISILQDCY